MPGKVACRIRTLLVLGALASFALVPTLAPAIAAKDDGPSKGAVASPKGAIGVKGVSQASPGFAAQQPVATEPALTDDPPSGLAARVGSLPFTGWDLIILGGVATILMGLGFMLHRLSTPRAPYA
jgi:hypothetical protein